MFHVERYKVKSFSFADMSLLFHVEQFFRTDIMHDIEPYYNWEKYYQLEDDVRSPFYGTNYDLTKYSASIYDHYIHPKWDFIGSETLYLKILYCSYDLKYCILELFGEWNDAINNDIMYFKRNVIDLLIKEGVNKFILIGENVLNFHGSDDCYYEEWFEDVEDGWIAGLNFQYYVEDQWKKFHIDNYINYGGTLNIEDWRTMTPVKVYDLVNSMIQRRLGM